MKKCDFLTPEEANHMNRKHNGHQNEVAPQSSERLFAQDEEKGKGIVSSDVGLLLDSVGGLSAKSAIRSLTVIGQVEGHSLLGEGHKTTKYEQVIPSLVALEEDASVKGLLILLNTVGGDVEAGLAIAEMIASMKKPTVSLVLGGGHSIGVPLAVAARRSFIVPTATMTLHPVRVSGTLIGAPQTYHYLARVQGRILRFVTRHSSISEERLLSLMMVPDQLATDIGSVLEGEEAVKEGLIDAVGGLADALSALYGMIEREGEGCDGRDFCPI